MDRHTRVHTHTHTHTSPGGRGAKDVGMEGTGAVRGVRGGMASGLQAATTSGRQAAALFLFLHKTTGSTLA